MSIALSGVFLKHTGTLAFASTWKSDVLRNYQFASIGWNQHFRSAMKLGFHEIPVGFRGQKVDPEAQDL